MPRPIVTLIAAVSADGFISRGEGVPWDLPRDREHFRARTAGRWLLLGRSTYQEMTGWFRDHTPLVLTRDECFHPNPGRRVGTVAEAIDLAEQAGVDELMVCGGGQVYAVAMPYADRLLITQVAESLGGGVPFPAIEPGVWSEQTREDHPADAEHAFALSFLTLTQTVPGQ